MYFKLFFTTLILTMGFNVSAKSNPWNKVKSVLAEDSIVLGLPLKAGTSLTMYIGNRVKNKGKVIRIEAETSSTFQFGNVSFQSPLRIEPGPPSVWLGAFNIGKSSIYHHELKSDINQAVQLTGELAQAVSIDGLQLKENETTSLFCELSGLNRSCETKNIKNFSVISGTLAASTTINQISLLKDDMVFFQPTKKKNQLLAFQNETAFRDLELNHKNLELKATVQARGAIFDIKGQTTAIYTKAREKILGIPLQQRSNFGAASIEIYPNGNIHLSPLPGTSTSVEGIPLGTEGHESYARLHFSPSGQLIEGLTFGEFIKDGILFQDETQVIRHEKDLSVQVSYGGSVYEGTWEGEKLFLHQPIFTFSSNNKLINVSCSKIAEASECNLIDDLNYVQIMKGAGKVIQF